ncbi:MAG TPA: CRTAC1 family protein [Deltaproteobacteria bacterium]|nr:CRTAC1 family protein [Deltaproteobacteria bacterium]
MDLRTFLLWILPACGGGAPIHGPDERMVEGPTVICADPDARAAAPLSQATIGADWPRSGDPVEGGRGIVVADLSGDGILDLFVPRTAFVSRILLGRGDGTFEDRTSEALPDGLSDALGASAADPDGDGDLDLIVYRARSPVVLLLNDGTGRFAIEPRADWDEGRGGCGGAAAWADVDLDGDLDLFYGRLGLYDRDASPPSYHPCPSRLLLGDGAGGFTDASDQLSDEVQLLRVMAAGWHQIDTDPWPELYVVTDLPEVLDGARLLDNGPGGLSPLQGTGVEVDLAGMGLAAADLNDDGITDFAVPGIDEIAVLRSTGPGQWIDWSGALGIVPDRARDQSVAWGGVFADLDNDGALDLPMGYGAIPQSPLRLQPDEIYQNTGAGTFEPVGSAWGFDDTGATRGLVVADLDGDGWLDLVKRELGGPVTVYTAACGSAHWLGIRLVGPAPNVFGIGARIEVELPTGTVSRMIEAGSTGFSSGGPPEAHLGLGTIDQIDEVRIVWPDGTTTHHPGPEPDRWIEITSSPDPGG